MKSFVLRVVAGVNAATVAVMLLIGYSDRLNPVDHPLLANLGLAFPIFLFLTVAFLVFWLVVEKRWALVSFAGLVLGYAPVRRYAPLNVPSKAPDGCVKVLSYNVFSFSTWTDLTTEGEILPYIMGQDADVVCLQECCAMGRKGEIVDSVMTPRYSYHRYSDSKNHLGDVVGIYSKYPIVGEEYISREGEAYTAVAYSLLMGARDTTVVIVAHLKTTGLSLDDRSSFKAMMKGELKTSSAEEMSRRMWHKLGEASAIRAPQADAIAEYVRRLGDRSVILAGDFNDSPLSYVHRRVASVLNDCYVSSANGPGISYHYNCFYVRIDNIMCSGQWEPYECRVDNTIKASDHYPIVCELKKK